MYIICIFRTQPETGLWYGMERNRMMVLAVALGLAMLPLQAFAAAGDPAHGKELYEECKGCHALNETLIGPKHCGVFGRKAGSVPGYAYSDVMKNAGFVWDEKHLDDFLKSPITYLSGTNMGYAGLDSAQDRADLIAYLRKAMDPAVCANQTDSQKVGEADPAAGDAKTEVQPAQK